MGKSSAATWIEMCTRSRPSLLLSDEHLMVSHPNYFGKSCHPVVAGSKPQQLDWRLTREGRIQGANAVRMDATHQEAMQLSAHLPSFMLLALFLPLCMRQRSAPRLSALLPDFLVKRIDT